MIGPQAWPPLCGAVAGCGALTALAGIAKLVRTARGTGGRTAVQRTLRLSDTPWRIFQALAGTAEAAVGLLVCAGVHSAAADALMACQGAIFTALLAYVIRARVPGDCGCVIRRRPGSAARHGVTRGDVARAVFITVAGIVGAASGVRSPSALSRFGETSAWATALVTFTLLAVIDLGLRTPRCRRPFLFPARTTLSHVVRHDVYLAMSASLGPRGEQVLIRRAGCIDQFWFPADPTQPGGPRYLMVETAPAAVGTLALRAVITEQPPHGGVRTLTTRRHE
jgi:hypothetical protein